MPISIPITVVGSYPKPDYLEIPDWFRDGMENYNVDHYNDFLNNNPKDLDESIKKATQEVIQEQIDLGVDIVSDGEVRRENYIHYFCRLINGFSFDNLKEIKIRNGNFSHLAPTIVSEISHPNQGSLLSPEWLESQSMSSKPVKMTLPGPMTILDTTANIYYKERKEASLALAKAINREVLYLAENGCKYIQIDEPIFAREPKLVMDYGINHLEQCFAGLPKDVKKIVHICCGYPNHLDQVDYPKANPDSYFRICPLLDNSPFIDAVSIEDTHRRNDLSLFRMFQKTEIILGVLNISSTKVETVEEIQKHIEDVLKVTKLISVAPDCGLAMLPLDICRQKLKNLSEAVNIISKKKE